MATERSDAAYPFEAFEARDVRVGDVIRYPAVIRRPARSRSERMVVARIEGHFLRCVLKVDGAKQERSVYPRQLRDNGVVVEAHVGD